MCWNSANSAAVFHLVVQTWVESLRPEVEKLPGKYKLCMPLERLAVLRALRPDRMSAGLTEFVTDVVGKSYVIDEAVDIEKTFGEASPSTPLLFMLCPGSDPTGAVEAVGRRLGATSETGRLVNISMGQGQEAPAEAALASFARNGGWVLLQNVHLMSQWLSRLEATLESLSETAHPDFRCVLTAEPPANSVDRNMPESLLQCCVKISNEAPVDARSAITRAWALFSPDRMEACKHPAEFKATLFALCFFHTVVLGRRQFGFIGWARPYSFNAGDLTICAAVSRCGVAELLV